jgi:hypothetical protein
MEEQREDAKWSHNQSPKTEENAKCLLKPISKKGMRIIILGLDYANAIGNNLLRISAHHCIRKIVLKLKRIEWIL